MTEAPPCTCEVGFPAGFYYHHALDCPFHYYAKLEERAWEADAAASRCRSARNEYEARKALAAFDLRRGKQPGSSQESQP